MIHLILSLICLYLLAPVSWAAAEDFLAPIVISNAVPTSVPARTANPNTAQWTVRQKADVRAESIYLSDVADCLGAESVCAPGYGLAVGSAPRAGSSILLSKAAIAATLAAELGIDPASVQGPENVQIEAVAILPDLEVIRQQLVQNLRNLEAEQGYRVEIKSLNLGNSTKLRPGSYSIRFPLFADNGTHPINWAQSRLQGRNSLEVELHYSGGRNPERLSLQLEATLWQNLWVAVRPLEKGYTLQVEDLRNEWRIFDGKSIWQGNPEELKGKQLRRAIASGDSIRIGDLEKLLQVRRGQDLQIAIRSGELSINSRAKALSDGSIGEWIEVQLLDAKKKLSAKVVGTGHVEAAL